MEQAPGGTPETTNEITPEDPGRPPETTPAATPLPGLDLQALQDQQDLPPDLHASLAQLARPGTIPTFPIRHFSPVTAYHLRAHIRATRPKVIYVEGPRAASPLIPALLEPDLVPPVAIYSAFVDHQNAFGFNGVFTDAETTPYRFELIYPFCEFSPELVALRCAAELQVPVQFVDLSIDQILPRLVGRDATPAPPPRVVSEKPLYTSSEFIQKLTRQAGFRNFDEVWDYFFETRGVQETPARFRWALLIHGLLIRRSIPVAVLEAQGTIAREQYMRAVIDHDLQARGLAPEEALVVCGALHAVTLPLVTPPADVVVNPLPTALPADQDADPAITHALIPYTYRKLSSLTGYASGVTAPEYYRLLWRAFERDQDPFQHATLEIIARVRTEYHRRFKSTASISTADAINAYQAAVHLASLKDKRFPTKADVVSGIELACDKGFEFEDANLTEVIVDVLLGNQVGHLPASVTRSPLTADFHVTLRRLALPVEDRPVSLVLNLRLPQDRAKSQFLHRVLLLEVPYCRVTASLDPRNVVEPEEAWELQYHPGIEARLLALGAEGTSLVQVIEDRVTRSIQAGAPADHLAAMLYAVALAGLTSLGRQIRQALQPALQASAQVHALHATLVGCTKLHALEALLPEVFSFQVRPDMEALFVDIAARIATGSAFHATPDDPDPELAHLALVQDLYALIAQYPDFAWDEEYLDAAVEQAARLTTSPLRRGGLLGILVAARKIPQAALQQEIRAYGQGAVEYLRDLGPFLLGVLKTNRAVFLGSSQLLAELTALLSQLAWDDYFGALPFLRQAFARLSQLERDKIADNVAVDQDLLGRDLVDETNRANAHPRAVDASTKQEMRAVEDEVDQFLDDMGFDDL